MGYYAQAHKLEAIASQSFSGVVDQVSYPILSKFQNDNNAMKSVLQKLLVSLSFVTFPMMLILILVAEPLILLLYGEQWLNSVPYFQILCFGGIAVCLQGVLYYAVASKGKSKDLFVWTIIKRSVGLLAMIIGLFLWNVNGLLWGYNFTSWFIFFANAYLVSKYINYSLLMQLRDLLSIILLSFIAFVLSYITSLFINCDIYIKSLVVVFVFFIIYILGSIVFDIKAYFFIKELLFNKFKK
jgi:O-antigen/teichoic acid export membrane protein